MFLNGNYCTLIVCGLCCVVGVYLGYKYTSNGYERRIAEYQAQAQEQLAKAQEKIISQERENQAAIRAIEQRGLDEKNSINAKYNHLLNELTRLRNENSRNKNNLSNHSATTSRTQSTCKCRQSRPYVEADKALEIARDCDLQAVRYNQLLKIYQSIEKRKPQ